MSRAFGAPGGYRLWGNGAFAHICFESPGCRFHQAGCCVMCDYGTGRKLTCKETVAALHHALEEWDRPIHRLLLGTCGSIFDPDEMEEQTVLSLCRELSATDIQNIIFETHYSTVNGVLLEKLVALLPNRNLFVELGLESADPVVLEKHLRKAMNLNALKESIALLHRYGIAVILNVFLGAPGLRTGLQLEDTKKAITWAYENGADEVVVFPANIKPETELWKQWKSGRYSPPSSWLLVELLRQLPDAQLETTSVSWYGDRQHIGIDRDILPPMVCPACEDRLQQFYTDYMKYSDSGMRRTLLRQVFEAPPCKCRKELLRKLHG